MDSVHWARPGQHAQASSGRDGAGLLVALPSPVGPVYAGYVSNMMNMHRVLGNF
jgi:hypothetical protein